MAAEPFLPVKVTTVGKLDVLTVKDLGLVPSIVGASFTSCPG